MNKSWCVYAHTNLENGKRYIGITSQTPESRWKSGHGYTHNPYFYNAILKYEWNSFSHDILLSGLSEREAKIKEIELIDLYHTNNELYGYNLTKGGDGALGRKVSNETKEKIRMAHKGFTHTDVAKGKISRSLIGNQYAKGHKHSKETLKKISETAVGNQYAKGNKLSAETRAKMSKSHLGMIPSEETRRKLSKANKRRIVSDETKAKISASNTGNTYRAIPIDMLTLNNDFIKTFASAKDAADEIGIDNSSISKACKGRQKSAGGYKWRIHIDDIN